MIKIQDAENGEIVYRGHSVSKAMVSYYKYSDSCEDDRFPVITVDGKKMSIYELVGLPR